MRPSDSTFKSSLEERK